MSATATAAVSAREFDLLAGLIEQECGIALPPEKTYLIETRLSSLVAQSGCSTYEEFYHLAKRGTDPGLKEKIINAITTNETLWFRDGHPFTILREVLLPRMAEQLRSGAIRKARIWSAASSTGQEAYSIAMTIHEFCRQDTRVRPEQFEVLGTDISSSVLFVARAGRYDQLAVGRGLPAEMRDRYMTLDGQVYAVRDEVKRLVTFQRFNLQQPASAQGRFDCVFLRYVAIYFSADFKRNLLKNIAQVTNRPGALLVGAVESLRGLTDDFEPRHHAGGYYYENGGK
ncbi:MAG: hypothetical protein GC168_00985 [Candidatus Hydrogenedens sp.]|nr:hypothetical protein [Candidatus Hydrogenedens sp.]